MRGAAALIKSAKLPNFANWRWTTFHEVAKAVAPIADILREHSGTLRPGLLRSRDKTWATYVLPGLDSQTCERELSFAEWFAEGLIRLEQWVGRVLRL